MDTITYGPFNLKTNKHAENLAEDSMKFFRGLLSGAYGFTEEELKSLVDLRRKSPQEVESIAETQTTRALYKIETEINQTTMTVRMLVANKESVKESLVTDDFKKFMTESITLEY